MYDAIWPPAQSPFDSMSEAEFTYMSASDKAVGVHAHYGEALDMDANGQHLSRYENGIWKIIPPSDLPVMWPGCSYVCALRSHRGKSPRSSRT